MMITRRGVATRNAGWSFRQSRQKCPDDQLITICETFNRLRLKVFFLQEKPIVLDVVAELKIGET